MAEIPVDKPFSRHLFYSNRHLIRQLYFGSAKRNITLLKQASLKELRVLCRVLFQIAHLAIPVTKDNGLKLKASRKLVPFQTTFRSPKNFSKLMKSDKAHLIENLKIYASVFKYLFYLMIHRNKSSDK